MSNLHKIFVIYLHIYKPLTVLITIGIMYLVVAVVLIWS
jgi:ABC-type arginine/histidine transport system permease subunit